MIRDYQNQDQADIIKLFMEFGKYIEDLDSRDLGLIRIPEDYGQKFCAQMLKDVVERQGKVFVLSEEEKVLGFIAGVIFDVGNAEDEIDCKAHRMGRVIWLHVTKESRGKGYGHELMQILEQYFKQKGCYKVNLEVFGPNIAAQGFYEKLGYRVRNLDLAKVLI